MTKKYSSVFSLVLFVVFSLFATNFSFSQVQKSFGPAPVSEKIMHSNDVVPDNVLNANNRAFIHLSATSSHQMYKQFLANTNVTAVGSPFTGCGWPGATTRNTTTGVIYICNQAAPFNIWSVDTTTGVCTQVLASCSGIPHTNFTGLVWDHTTNTMYGCSSDITTSAIFTVNMTTGVCTPIGTSTSVCAAAISLSCAPNGTLFSVDIVGNNLYKWNKTTGVPTLVGALGVDANYGQDAAFDLSDGILYWACAAPTYSLRTIDTTTGSGTNVIGNVYTAQPSCITVIGNMGPAVSHTPLPNTTNVTGPYVVNAVVAPSGSAISSTKLYWSRNNVTVTDSVTMTNSSGNNWTGNIPGNGAAATYRYYIKAIDGLGRVGTHPGNAPAGLNTFIALANDTAKPVITHTALGNQPKQNWPATVTATVTDNIGVDSAWVRWYKNTTANYKQFKLTNTSGSTYTSLFNSVSADVNPGDTIFYRIIAQDNSSSHNRDSTALYKFAITNLIPNNICRSVWVPIRDNTSNYDSFQVGTHTAIVKVNFTMVELIHSYDGDVTFALRAPNGTEVTLTANNGASGDNYINTIFNDSATTPIASGTAPFTGTFNPTNPLSAFNGLDAYGWWRFKVSDNASGDTGHVTQYCVQLFAGGIITGTNAVGTIVPSTYSLNQNYPNPFNPVTKINFAIPKQGLVSLKIYDVLGRQVRTLVNEVKAPGSYSVDFNGADLSSGVYFYRLESNGFTDIKKMMLIK